MKDSNSKVKIAALFAAAIAFSAFVGGCTVTQTAYYDNVNKFAIACVENGGQFINYNCVR